jgi:hypothetical protein
MPHAVAAVVAAATHKRTRNERPELAAARIDVTFPSPPGA